MKLLSVNFSCHDGNMSYFDGKKLHYSKLERPKQIKRFSYDDGWQWKYEVKRIFNVNISEIDEIVFDFNLINNGSVETIEETLHKPLSVYLWGEPYFMNIGYNELSNETKRTFIEKFRGVQKYFKCPIDLCEMFHHRKDNLWMISHHYSHSLSGWMLQEKEPDIKFILDGYGDYLHSGAVYRGDDLIANVSLENSIGNLIVNLSQWAGIKSSSILDYAGKLMGLQSYGKTDEGFLKLLRQYDINEISEMFDRSLWFQYKGDDLVSNLDALNYCATIHKRVGEILVETFSKYAHPHETIFYAGGIAQNVVWNTELRKHFPNLIIAPHSADEGLSLGGIEFLRKKNNLPKFSTENFPYWQSDVAPIDEPSDDDIKIAAELLAEGKIVSWYQGHGEVGPRALGNRSILMDPRISNGKEIINGVKNRENYRPFGASVLKEYQSDYFDLDWDDDYMLYTTKVKVNTIPAVTHVDGTCRVQTVTDKNPAFRKLLLEFYKLTGCPVILNTSLNISGKPLAAYPEVAKELFDRTNIYALFIGDSKFVKDDG
jgi:carbamoyltransferase